MLIRLDILQRHSVRTIETYEQVVIEGCNSSSASAVQYDQIRANLLALFLALVVLISIFPLISCK